VEKLLAGVNFVMFLPTVKIVLDPNKAIPTMNEAEPIISPQIGTSAFPVMGPAVYKSRITIKGPIAFPTSFAPCAIATAIEEITNKGIKGS